MTDGTRGTGGRMTPENVRFVKYVTKLTGTAYSNRSLNCLDGASRRAYRSCLPWSHSDP